MVIQANETYRFEQEIVFDGHIYGTDYSFPYGGECQIIRGADGFFWNGSAFTATPYWNSTTVDPSGLFHYFDWQVPATAANGDVFNLKIRIFEDADTETVIVMQTRPSGGSSGGGIVFDAIDFVTGIPLQYT